MSKAKKQKNANKHRALSAQQTIPYIAMHPDGICQLPGGLYTKTLEYEDINYAVASTEDQTAIISGWSACLNYFDSSLPFQLSFVNRRNRDANRYKVNIPAQEDDFNSIRGEYVEMLKGQIAKSNNGIERYKYITFGLPAGGVAEARPRLGRVEADVMGNLKRLGVQSCPLDGRDRLAVLHGQMHPGGREPFRFAWKDIPKTGMGTKDYIAPDSFDFRQSRTFRVGQMWGAASYLQIMASELSDKLLAEILELDAELTVTMHIQTVDQLKAIKTIKGKIADIGRMKAEEQKRAVRAGYDMEILPPDLITFSKDAAELLSDLQSRNERMFLLTFTVVNLAPTRQRLENDVFTVSGIAQKYNCALRRLDWQQEQGFVSSLALGYNGIEIQRGMTTSSTAIFIPFMTRELRMDGQALYYGMNALSNNVIMADRKKLKSANGMYLGSTGSGKSFAAKRELINVFLATNDRIIVVDPMGEYAPLVRRLGGQVIEIAPDSPHHISPMDLQMNINDEDSPLSMKADFLLSLCELIVGGKEGLQPIEKTVIDRCVRLVYREMALGLETAKTPLLQDLYEELLRQPEPEARRVATALELYCTGSLNLFNHPTNVDLNSRVVCIVLITFITTRPRWTAPRSSGTLSALAVRCGGSLTAFALKMICPSSPIPSCTARGAFSIMGRGWGRSGSPRTRSSYGLPSMKLLPNAPPILMLSSGSWRRPASRSSMGAAAQFLFLFRGRSGRPGCGRPPSGTVTIPRTLRPSSPGSARSRSSLFPRLPPLAVSI